MRGGGDLLRIGEADAFSVGRCRRRPQATGAGARGRSLEFQSGSNPADCRAPRTAVSGGRRLGALTRARSPLSSPATRPFLPTRLIVDIPSGSAINRTHVAAEVGFPKADLRTPTIPFGGGRTAATTRVVSAGRCRFLLSAFARLAARPFARLRCGVGDAARFHVPVVARGESKCLRIRYAEEFAENIR